MTNLKKCSANLKQNIQKKIAFFLGLHFTMQTQGYFRMTQTNHGDGETYRTTHLKGKKIKNRKN